MEYDNGRRYRILFNEVLGAGAQATSESVGRAVKPRSCFTSYIKLLKDLVVHLDVCVQRWIFVQSGLLKLQRCSPLHILDRAFHRKIRGYRRARAPCRILI